MTILVGAGIDDPAPPIRQRRKFRQILAARIWLLPVFCVPLACTGDAPTEVVNSASASPYSMSATAWAYINAALDTMQTHSIKRYEIEWPTFKDNVYPHAYGAVTTGATYNAIRQALIALGDNHSSFYEPTQAAAVTATAPQANTPPEGRRLRDFVGYVKMPGFSSRGLTPQQIVAHATAYHTLLRSIDTTGMCGWIVDLRTNTGGNMWPMIAGIGPVVGDGMLGMFVDPDSVETAWYYRDGASVINDYDAVQVTGAPVQLQITTPAVAVLTGPSTASSGEAVVVSFRNRPKTRSFGQGTWGVSTANAGFMLSDGAMLNLTVAWMADRTGHIYGSVINPDEAVYGTATFDEDTDPAIQAAKAWLALEGDCGGN
jgi:carboxyl-terminal processing protease